MYHQPYLEAIEAVLSWGLPDEALADAINLQFTLITTMSGDANDPDSSFQ